MEIEKTNRMNALFEFYAALLTDKQMNYIELYYADDYSLAEIAEEFGVSRQAVYDNIKRTEKILEAYEMKLHMYSDYIVRSQIFDDIMEKYPDDSYLQEQIAVLSSIDNIKRTEKILEAYEMKLHMYSDYIVRSQIFDDIMEKYPDDSYLQEQIAVLSSIDNRD